MSSQSPFPIDASAPPVLNEDTRAQIIDDLVEVVAVVANAQLDGLTTRLAQALLEASAASTCPALAKANANAAALLRKNRYPFAYVAAERVRTVLLHELRAAARGLANPGEASGALKSLAPEIEVDKTLCLRKAGRVLEEAHAERLGALALRLAQLFGRNELAPSPHPFRPQVFLTVLHDAWCEFHPDTSAHPLLFPLLGGDCCLDPAPLLQAANTALIKRGILPQLGREPDKAAVAATATMAAAEAAHAPNPDDLELEQQLRRLFGDPPIESGENTGYPQLLDPSVLTRSLGHARLFDYVAQHASGIAQESEPCGDARLLKLCLAAPDGTLEPGDRKAVEMLAAVFDDALQSPGLAPEMQRMLATLQLPILKAALAERHFFYRVDQPARRAIELLTELALGWSAEKGAVDPIYLTVKRNVERIGRSTAYQAQVFVDTVWDLESFRRREQTATAQILAVPIAHAIRQERLRHAERNARNEVALRIGSGEVVAFVETFLEDRWVPVLTLAYSHADEEPNEVRDALKTMDDLVWSVKPKISPAERRDLLAMLPGLVASLNRWLDRIEWSDAERSRFFSELAACHASLVRAPLPLTPQKQLELALASAQQAAERRLNRQSQQAPVRVPDEFDERVRRLERGAWIELEQDGQRRRMKLAWVSPMRSFYLLSLGERTDALSLSDEALALALREGRARVLEAGGLVRRVLAATLAANAANRAHTEDCA